MTSFNVVIDTITAAATELSAQAPVFAEQAASLRSCRGSSSTAGRGYAAQGGDYSAAVSQLATVVSGLAAHTESLGQGLSATVTGYADADADAVDALDTAACLDTTGSLR